jgi:hypothetical protein
MRARRPSFLALESVLEVLEREGGGVEDREEDLRLVPLGDGHLRVLEEEAEEWEREQGLGQSVGVGGGAGAGGSATRGAAMGMGSGTGTGTGASRGVGAGMGMARGMGPGYMAGEDVTMTPPGSTEVKPGTLQPSPGEQMSIHRITSE